jgi:heme-degrading monooxygenase HmoA
VFSRVTLLEIDPLRTEVGSAFALFREGVRPRLREQDGYAGVIVLATPGGQAMLVSFWATEEAVEATAETGFYAEALAEHATLFRSPPGRERYEVLLAELDGVTVG